MRKRVTPCFILLIVAFSMHSCKLEFKDSFYSKSCGYDCKKIPLVKPCYLGSTTGIEGEWNLSNCYGHYGAVAVCYTNVLDSIVISFYYDKYIVIPEKRDTTWYIHIPSIKQEFKFSEHKKFSEQVEKLTYKKVEFFEVAELYNKLVEKGYLVWFPEEFKTK